ncbi:bacillithiol biosynthesis cysteine-adding enzyme BshC [Paenibacillus beijingensis]|uniref:Putative cysteine ligase BshC n=1 Tax=Paenibacillus beijingensis TaxID=1126833 RepID=A0A0D5NM71_9BACL|nr:bacillithiol biosynthesis cysteine-adding enzyme BshC [Paenibacillus beijingensis]AJY76356.1 hypothetical protein VN24_19525 [Paenibacillus beijingensis]
MKMESYRLPSAQPLAEAYSDRTDSRLDALFGYHPADPGDWHKRLAALARPNPLRAPAERTADALRAYNRRFNASPQTEAALNLLAEGAPVVVGGQQAVLWTGPMLVIHKALSIVQTAKWASQTLRRPVVPVFWIAGEDHDWDEASHTYIPHHEEGIRKLEVARPAGARTSVSRTALTESKRKEMLAELVASLPDSEHKPQLLDRLCGLVSRCGTLTELCAGMLGMLFGSEGLVLLDSDDPALRRVEGPMFRQLIARNDELEAAYGSASKQVSELGYKPQADAAAGGANLFLFRPVGASEAERTLLFKRDGAFTDKRGVHHWTNGQLLEIAESEPELLSNNVLTRPLMQEYLFPVLSTVLGPGEIAYWAQTGEAFRLFGMEMPIVTPRMGFTLIEPAAAKHMDLFGLSFDDVLHRFDDHKSAWLKQQDRFGIEMSFAAAKLRFEELYRPLLNMAADVERGLAALGESNLQRILGQIQYMHDKTEQAFRQTQMTSVRRFDAIAGCIAPLGKPQERAVNMLHFWNRYGPGWMEPLLAAPFEPGIGHRIIYL